MTSLIFNKKSDSDLDKANSLYEKESKTSPKKFLSKVH